MGVGEVVLEALCDRDRGHRRDDRDQPRGRVSWPIAGIGRVISPRSTAEADGEKDRDMGEPQGASAAAAPGEEPAAARAGMILTPDQRVRVFISSTLGELAAERAAARRGITRLHLVPAWYESGGPPHPPRCQDRAFLEERPGLVGVFVEWGGMVGIDGQRWGGVAWGMEVCGLEDEFRRAAGKPMLLYLKRPAPDQEPRLAAMIDGIRAAGTVSYRTFATPRELERLLADDLAVLLSEHFAGRTRGGGAAGGGGGRLGGPARRLA